MSRRQRIDPPLHIADQALVGPLIRFRGGKQAPVPAPPPRDTLDPRYSQCIKHHLACDCREAEQNEIIGEYRSEWAAARRTLAEMIRGHATDVVSEQDGEQRPDLQCQCQLCEFARRTRLVPLFDNSRRIPAGPLRYQYPF